MKFIYVTIIAFVVIACKKSEVDIVERFVHEVKAERYEEIKLPAFNASHIDALMQHASDKQMVSNYPRPMYSSYYGGPIEVGLVMLYTIEAVRLQVEWPSSTVRVFDEQDIDRVFQFGKNLHKLTVLFAHDFLAYAVDAKERQHVFIEYKFIVKVCHLI